MEVSEDLAGGVVVAPGIEVAVGFDCDDAAVPGGAEPRSDPAPVALVMAHDAFFP
jgi:hypothetical protein